MSIRAIVVVLAATLVTPASAGIEKLSEVAWWSVYGGTREDGASICALVTVTPSDTAQKFILEYVLGSQTASARMLKPTWSIPNSTRTPVLIQFGYSKPVQFEAVGSGTELRISIPVNRFPEFISRMKAGLGISFHGKEAPWSISLGGEGMVESEFIRCINMHVPERPPTQPYR